MWIGRHCYVRSRGRKIPVPCNPTPVVSSHQAKSAGLPQLGSMDLAQLKEVLAQVQAAQNEDHEDDEDYAEHYREAAELQQQIQGAQDSRGNGASSKLQVAQLQCRRGLALVQTDLAPEGEKELLQALPVLEADQQQIAAAHDHSQQPDKAAKQRVVERTTVLLQSAYNALGALWTRRSDFKAALLWLNKAQQLRTDYHHNNAYTQECEDLETGYTTTLFYLAQVHGHAGNKLESAAYCGRTLQRQLSAGTYDRSEWVQNCLQLAGYYVSINAFQVAAYCIAAAQLVAEGRSARAHAQAPAQQAEKTAAAAVKQEVAAAGEQVVPAATDLKAASTERQAAGEAADAAAGMQASGLQPLPSKLQDAGEMPQDARTAAAEPAAAADYPQPLNAAAGPQPHTANAGSSGMDTRDKDVLQVDSDVAANLELALAKLYRQQLSAAYKQHVQQQSVRMPDRDGVFGNLNAHSSAAAANNTRSSSSSSEQLAAPEFSLEGLPNVQDDKFLQHSILASEFEQARSLFNQGMEHYNTALKFYELDGYVTEHVGILLEISHMYKLLAGFEPSPLRRAAMHKQRATRLEPVSGDVISCQAYRGLVRSIELECGTALRESMEARLEHDNNPNKHVAAAATAAVQHFAAFMNTFRPAAGEPLPDHVPDDQEDVFLNVAFTMGRTMQQRAGMEPPGELQRMQLGSTLSHLEWVCQYVQRNHVAAFQKEAELASELAELVAEKLKLLQRVQLKAK